MRMLLVASLPLFLSCFSVSTAFVPLHHTKVALIPRQVPPIAFESRFEHVNHIPTRLIGLHPLSYSISEEVSKLNKGKEDDPISDEDLRQVRDILVLLVKQELEVIDLFKTLWKKTLVYSGLQKLLQPLKRSSLPLISQNDTLVGSINATGMGPGLFQVLLDVVQSLIDHPFNEGEDIKYATYPLHQEFPDVTLSDLMKRVPGVPPRDYIFSPRKFFRLFLRLFHVLIGLILTDGKVNKAATVREKYTAVFTEAKIARIVPNPLNWIPKTKYVVKHWDEDREFARQFLNGVNPLMIQAVRDIQKNLTKELIDFLEKDGTIRLKSLAEQKRLLFVSYDDLAELTVNPHEAYPKVYNPTVPQDNPRYFSAPIVVFQLSADLQELDVLAIQLDRKPGAEIYSPNPSITNPNTWLFAKTIVTTADSQMHEWVSHLGKTHLTMEPHIIAIHNTLKKKNHPLYTFFKPIIKDTLFLGYAARATLAAFGPKSFGDWATSVGVGQFMQLIKKYWNRYSFFESSGLENELASRGFDNDFNIPCYYYREDGLKLWNAYGRFATDFLNEIYQSDSDVANDAVLQEWARETTDESKAAVPGFPKSFSDKKTLAAVMQTLFWVASGLHAAVNYPQYDYYAYLANHPLGFRKNMELFKQSKEQNLNWMFTEAFPLPEVVQQIIIVAWGLTLPSETCIDNLSDNFNSKAYKNAYKNFRKELKGIGKEIDKRNKRNKKRGVPIYPYLHPSKVPASIDI